MKDRFSDKASGYAKFRPQYPSLLFNFIYSHVNSFDTAWDAGTGNGQVAGVLASRFNRVYATDISIKQLMKVPGLPNLSSFVADETAPQISDGSIDLVTAAQAVHWFDTAAFNREVARVAKPGGLLAVWGYGLVELPEPWQEFMAEFYTKTLGSYWDPERHHIDTAYSELEFPFREIPVTQKITMKFTWDLKQFEGYLNTWSAVGNYTKINSNNPVGNFVRSLPKMKKAAPFEVKFPLFIRLFRV